MKGNKTHTTGGAGVAKDAIGLGDKLNEGWDL